MTARKTLTALLVGVLALIGVAAAQPAGAALSYYDHDGVTAATTGVRLDGNNAGAGWGVFWRNPGSTGREADFKVELRDTLVDARCVSAHVRYRTTNGVWTSWATLGTRCDRQAPLTIGPRMYTTRVPHINMIQFAACRGTTCAYDSNSAGLD